MIEELKDTFREHADGLFDEGLPARTSAVRRRVRATSRRRAVAAGAAVAVAVPLATIAMLLANPFGSSDSAPAPTGPEESVVDVRDAFAGRTLLEAAKVEGESELVLTADAPNGSQWMVFCAGLGTEYTMHVTLDGTLERATTCEHVPHPDGTMSFRFDDDEPAGRRVLRAWITLTSDGSVVTPADGVLAAAVYELPAPAATVAGKDVMPVEENLGYDWEVADHGESVPGARSYTATFPARAVPGILEIVTTGTGSGAAEVGLLVDGVAVTVPDEHNDGGTFVLGTSHVGTPLAKGAPHTVTLRIHGDVPSDARLGIVWRTQVPK